METKMKKINHKENSKVEHVPLTETVAHKAGRGFGDILGIIFEHIFIFIWLIILVLAIGVIMTVKTLLEKLGVIGAIILFVMFFVTVSLPVSIVIHGGSTEPIFGLINPKDVVFFMKWWWAFLLGVILVFGIATEDGRGYFGRALRGLVLGANVDEGGVDNEKD